MVGLEAGAERVLEVLDGFGETFLMDLSLIIVILVAHFVGDFICQTDWMALNKSKRWDALGLHVITYTSILFICVAFWHDSAILSRPIVSYGVIWAFVGVNAVAHFVQDAITSRINARLWFLIITPTGDTGKIWRGSGDGSVRVEPLYVVEDSGTRHWFFVCIGADQLLHYITLFATATYLLA